MKLTPVISEKSLKLAKDGGYTFMVDKGLNNATRKIIDVRQQNFSKRVWSALPPEKQQVVKASLPQIKK